MDETFKKQLEDLVKDGWTVLFTTIGPESEAVRIVVDAPASHPFSRATGYGQTFDEAWHKVYTAVTNVDEKEKVAIDKILEILG